MFEAEVARKRLGELGLRPGDDVTVVFRHVRLFRDNRYVESDVRDGRLVESGGA
jgi:Fe2+ transport system protein FeoA